MSVEYYAKLERGSLGGVSASVLDAIARAIQLEKPNATTCSTWPTPPTAPAPLYAPAAAAATTGPRGRACNGPSTASLPRRRSWATIGPICLPPTTSGGRYTLTSTTTPTARPTSPGSPSSTAPPTASTQDWDLAADMTVANLRTAAGQDPHNKELHDLVGELSTRSDEFRRRLGRPQRPHPRHRH
jgi:MmyB-like transcription regulator ligand binding domain